MIKRNFLILQILFLSSFVYSQCADGTEVCLSLDGGDLNYDSTVDIAGFQFNHNGCVTSASGGDAAANGFAISASGSAVIGFSFTGGVVPAGSGTLIELGGDITEECLSDFIFSSSAGGALVVAFAAGGGDDGGDDASCADGTEVCLSLDGGDLNYDSTVDIAGFQFNHNGCVTSASGGDAAANGFAISASGSAVIGFSFTGGVVPAGSGTLIELGGDITEECLSDFIFSSSAGGALVVAFAAGGGDDGGDDASCADGTEVCLSLDGGDLNYDSTVDIAGFQFAHNGCVFDTDGNPNNNASGGDAGANGFAISSSGSAVIGFSFTGGVVPAGSGTLVELEGDVTEDCLFDFVFAAPNGDPLIVAFAAGGGDDCSSGVYDCAGVCDGDSIEDCAGECGGSAVVDECGECGGDGIADGACDCDGNGPEENYDCDGNCTVAVDECGECGGDGIDEGACDCAGNVEDCAGECGGSATNDDCGVCDGDGSSCEVYIESTVETTVDEAVLDDLDEFTEDFESYMETELDLPDGSVEVTDVTVNTDSRDDIEITIDYTITLTEEELAESDFESEDDINEALDEAESELEDDGVPDFVYGCTDEGASNYDPEATIDDGSCETGPELVDYCLDLHFGANLISFHSLPEDVTIGNIMSSLEGVVTGVIGEGVAASPNPVLGWVGSLSSISETSGYWVKVDESSSLCLADAAALDASTTTYDLHFGANLISFPYDGAVDLATALPDDVEGSFTGVIGEGVAASPNPVLGWVGSLSQFEGGKGYWAKVDASVSFNFNIEDTDSRAIIGLNATDFGYTQSTEQAFYFIEDIIFEDGSYIESGDIVLAYNDNVLVGAREWSGSFTDIPAMGYDGSSTTIGYCDQYSSPELRVVKSSTGDEYTISSAIPAWTSNGIYQMGVLMAVDDVYPDSYTISGAYPNPFNPSTRISIDISETGLLNLSMYNSAGQLMDVLHSGEINAGSYEFVWDASSFSSGIYFAKMTINGSVVTSKLMLIK